MWKQLLLSKILPYLAFFFMPILPIIIGVFILIIFDIITAIRKSKKKGEAITSKKMRNSIDKVILYFIAIIASRVLETLFGFEIPIASLVGGFIGVIEFKSIIENVSDIVGMNLWKYLAKKIKIFGEIKDIDNGTDTD